MAMWDDYFRNSPNPCYTLIEDLANSSNIVDELEEYRTDDS